MPPARWVLGREYQVLQIYASAKNMIPLRPSQEFLAGERDRKDVEWVDECKDGVEELGRELFDAVAGFNWAFHGDGIGGLVCCCC